MKFVRSSPSRLACSGLRLGARRLSGKLGTLSPWARRLRGRRHGDRSDLSLRWVLRVRKCYEKQGVRLGAGGSGGAGGFGGGGGIGGDGGNINTPEEPEPRMESNPEMEPDPGMNSKAANGGAGDSGGFGGTGRVCRRIREFAVQWQRHRTGTASK